MSIIIVGIGDAEFDGNVAYCDITVTVNKIY